MIECLGVLLLGPPADFERSRLLLFDAPRLLAALASLGDGAHTMPSRAALEVATSLADAPTFTAEALASAGVPSACSLCAWCIAVVRTADGAMKRLVTLHRPRPPGTPVSRPISRPSPRPSTQPVLLAVGAPRVLSRLGVRPASQSPRRLPALPSAAHPDMKANGHGTAPAEGAAATLRAKPPLSSRDSQRHSSSSCRPSHPHTARAAVMQPTPPPGTVPHRTMTPRPHRPMTLRPSKLPRALQPVVALANQLVNPPTAPPAVPAAKTGGEDETKNPADNATEDAAADDEVRRKCRRAKAQLKATAEMSRDARALTMCPTGASHTATAQAAALRELLNACEHTSLPEAWGEAAASSLAFAQRAAAPPPPNMPELEEVNKEEVFQLARGALNGVPGQGTKALASLWLDGGLRAAKAKFERATLAKWRQRRADFARAAGLRQQLLIACADSVKRREDEVRCEAEAKAGRMRLWRIEDAAAVHIQEAWRDRQQLRYEAMALESTQKLMHATRHAQHQGATERARMAKQARLRRMRRRSTGRTISAGKHGGDRAGSASDVAGAFQKSPTSPPTSPPTGLLEAPTTAQASLSPEEGKALSEVYQISRKVDSTLGPLLESLQARVMAWPDDWSGEADDESQC